MEFIKSNSNCLKEKHNVEVTGGNYNNKAWVYICVHCFDCKKRIDAEIEPKLFIQIADKLDLWKEVKY